MFENVIFSDEFITVAVEENKVYLKMLKEGYNISHFKDVNDLYPRIKITQFVAFKSAIDNALETFIEIGVYKNVIEISSSKDRLEAYATLNMDDSSFGGMKPEFLVDLILNAAEKAGINHGIDVQSITSNVLAREAFLIAKGRKPVKGDDAEITLFEIEDAKPEIIEDGSVNHYELNLINKANEGDWLGERIEPTEGIPGITVYGEVLKAESGNQEKLIYDRKTIKQTLSDDGLKTTLTSRRIGAVVYENGVLTVCNYLEIDGKVSFKTGNIDFDGFVDIKSTVEDNFSVIADHDIQIRGELGIGAVNSIESREGNIYIRGGIAGQDKAEIICDGDLYTKFAADCTIKCNGSVYIGYYAMNAKIEAKEVILDSLNSRIIGGEINADIRVCAGEIGSKSEVMTRINVKGFEREQMLKDYDNLGITIDKLKQMSQLQKQKLSVYKNIDIDDMDKNKRKEMEQLELEYERCQKSLKVYNQKRKNLVGYLHAKGEGEIQAMKYMHPNVHMSIGHDDKVNKEDQKIGITYFLKDKQIVSDM